MDRSIWVLSYGVEAAREAEYLDWFHGVHIPEKLSRPGYAWAAHYRALEGDRHLALFGAMDAGAFLAPTPGQLRLRQDELTRKMMGARSGGNSTVLAEALRIDGLEARKRAPDNGTVRFVRYAHFSLPDAAAEDAACAWVTQQRFAQLAAARGIVGARFMLALLGAGKYAVLEEYATVEALGAMPAEYPEGAAFVGGSPFEGRRLCPA